MQGPRAGCRVSLGMLSAARAQAASFYVVVVVVVVVVELKPSDNNWGLDLACHIIGSIVYEGVSLFQQLYYEGGLG